MKKTPCLAIFAVLACYLTLAACSGEPGAGKDGSAASPPLRLGVMPSMDYLPLAVALREGYCAEEGLDLVLVKFYSANERDAALQSGGVDGAVIDYTGGLLQRSGGFDVKLTSACDAPFYVIAGKSSGITSLEDLRGAKIALSRNTVIDYLLDMALSSVSIRPDEVEKVEINKIPLRFEMLESGRIDVTGLPNPLALMAERAGHRVLTSNQELGFAVTGILFAQKTLDERSDDIRAFYRAYDRGVAYLSTHGIADIADILHAEMGYPEDLLPHARIPAYSPATPPSDADMIKVAAWLAERGLIPVDFPGPSAIAPGYTAP